MMQQWSQSPVPPRTKRAYETHLSAGSTAVLLRTAKNGSLTRSCTGLIRLPSEGIDDNALRALHMVSLTGFAPVISCMRGRRVDWTTPQGQKWWERSVPPALPLVCQTSALLMSYTPELVSPSGLSPAT